MPRPKVLRVLIATDGSSSAGRAVTMATHVPWPANLRVRAVVARRIDSGLGESPLLATWGDTADTVAKAAKRRLQRTWPDAEAVVVDATPVEGILREAKRFAADVIV